MNLRVEDVACCVSTRPFANFSQKDKMKNLFIALILSASFTFLRAQDHGWPVAAQVFVPDVQVVTQTGEHLRFSSELLKGRVAIITGFFTSCTSMCPITQESLAHVAKLLGPRLGKDVIIVSLSTDPENDTPARMKAWAEKFHIASGWMLASGNKADVQSLLKSLGLYVDIPQRHQSLLMIGSESSGWVRVSSWTPAEKLVKLVKDQRENAKKAIVSSTNQE
jgi:cytochrome oxidase Cu insertion factor (SCO1/SenC/PrrC family)